jgi:phosphoribosylanthranilate isomerase
MPLKTVVKVGNISNLGDARYCSGMGVDMLGFSVIQGNPDYITPKLFQEIRGWISGPKIVAEIYGIQSPGELPEILKNYAPDYFELNTSEYLALSKHISLPSIVTTTLSDIRLLSEDGAGIAYVQREEPDQKIRQPILLKISSAENLLQKIDHPQIAGVALTCSREVRPGFKDGYELTDVLELLDE